MVYWRGLRPTYLINMLDLDSADMLLDTREVKEMIQNAGIYKSVALHYNGIIYHILESRRSAE